LGDKVQLSTQRLALAAALLGHFNVSELRQRITQK
jgi:hypothetical protein